MPTQNRVLRAAVHPSGSPSCNATPQANALAQPEQSAWHVVRHLACMASNPIARPAARIRSVAGHAVVVDGPDARDAGRLVWLQPPVTPRPRANATPPLIPTGPDRRSRRGNPSSAPAGTGASTSPQDTGLAQASIGVRGIGPRHVAPSFAENVVDARAPGVPRLPDRTPETATPRARRRRAKVTPAGRAGITAADSKRPQTVAQTGRHASVPSVRFRSGTGAHTYSVTAARRGGPLIVRYPGWVEGSVGIDVHRLQLVLRRVHPEPGVAVGLAHKGQHPAGQCHRLFAHAQKAADIDHRTLHLAVFGQ